MTELFSWEAEEATLGYLLNNHIDKDKKVQLLQILDDSYYTNSKFQYIFSQLKRLGPTDKIVLWDKISHSAPGLKLDWVDIEQIDDFVTEEQIDAYVSILMDRYQKRRLHDFGKDVQDAMVAGKDQFEVALKAQSLLTQLSSRSKLETNQELLDRVLDEQPGDVLSSGYQQIDAFIGGYARGMIIAIAGDSGHLKTTLALDKAFRMAERNPKIKVGIFSKEMLATDLMKKQIARICGIPTSLIFSQRYDKDFVRSKMMEIEAWRNNRIRIINPNSFSGVADIARIQMTHRFDVWFLDFIQLLEFAKAANNSSDYNIQIGQNMRNLQSLALATKSVGIVLSQVKKGIEHRRVMKPTISDIEWSGLIKQLSSYIFFSYYPGKYYGFNAIPEDHYYLVAEKTRFAESFIYPMKVNPGLGTFQELPDAADREKMTALLRQITD
jgi:replicative DNA helicase